MWSLVCRCLAELTVFLYNDESVCVCVYVCDSVCCKKNIYIYMYSYVYIYIYIYISYHVCVSSVNYSAINLLQTPTHDGT